MLLGYSSPSHIKVFKDAQKPTKRHSECHFIQKTPLLYIPLERYQERS